MFRLSLCASPTILVNDNSNNKSNFNNHNKKTTTTTTTASTTSPSYLQNPTEALDDVVQTAESSLVLDVAYADADHQLEDGVEEVQLFPPQRLRPIREQNLARRLKFKAANQRTVFSEEEELEITANQRSAFIYEEELEI